MARPDQLRGQVEENLRQLGRDHLDLANLRILSVSKPVGEHFAALAELRDTGLIRYLGLSNVTVEQIDEALAIAPVVTVQNRTASTRGGQRPMTCSEPAQNAGSCSFRTSRSQATGGKAANGPTSGNQF